MTFNPEETTQDAWPHSKTLSSVRTLSLCLKYVSRSLLSLRRRATGMIGRSSGQQAVPRCNGCDQYATKVQ